MVIAEFQTCFSLFRRFAAGGLFALLAALLALLPVPAAAQVESRAELIIAERRKKAENLGPEKPYPLEERLIKLKELGLFDPVQHGLKPRIGGLPTSQGFALGPQYMNSRLAGDRLFLRTSLAGSVSQAWLADFQLTTRRLADDRVFADLLVEHLNAPRLDYYGQGPDSDEGSRTNYRLETNTVNGTFGVRPFRTLSLGVSGGYLTTEAGMGNRDGTAQTSEVFDPVTTPALVDQSDFLLAGVFAQFDYRDNPGGARRGGNYLARLTHYDDRDLNRHSFRQLHLEAQQYIPFFQDRRVIALRARTVMTFTNGAGQSVPFYLKPYIGGSEDLRGFRSYRFHDDNHIIVNAEYRWETFGGLDMAAFFDAGKVAPKRSQINFHNLETAVGFGFRFNARNSTFIRLDVGFSHEGYQVWFKFANPF